ncbi:MAG: hypothetical protein ABR570_16975 [Burkholderiales bacterium]
MRNALQNGADDLEQNFSSALDRFNRLPSAEEERAMRRELIAGIVGLIVVLAVIGWAFTL